MELTITEEFFARLANISDVNQLPETERNTLVEEMLRVMPKTTARVQEAVIPPAISSALGFGPTQDQVQERQHANLSAFLAVTHAQARRCILGLLSGEQVELPYPATPVGQIKGRRLVESFDATGEKDLLFAVLLETLRRQPFPFGQCPVCHKVFVQHDIGAPRRFCSGICKGKGILSAAKRSEYSHAWRQRKRERERDIAQRLLRTWPEERQYLPRLQKELPDKSRRQLLHLIKQVRREMKTQGKEA